MYLIVENSSILIVQGLRALLEQTENSQRSAEKEKSLLITQLTEQNQRLTSQLKDVSIQAKMKNSHFHCLQSSKIEESLTCELQSMRDQVNHKKTSMTEHVTHLETLRFAILSFASSPLLCCAGMRSQ